MDRKLSIRFYKDREVRAVWDGEHNKWWFSVLDIIGVLNEQDDYSKNRNYWKYLKTKLKKENTELVSTTNQLKMQAKDGKMYKTDVLDNEGIMLLARSFPNNKAAAFLDCANSTSKCKITKCFLHLLVPLEEDITRFIVVLPRLFSKTSLNDILGSNKKCYFCIQ